jgi:outer membrane protein assembly factor BamA
MRRVLNTFRPRIFLTLLLLEIAILPFPGAAKPQANATAVTKIGAMHVEGARVISAEKVIAATGLKSGDRFDVDRLNAVMQKLGKSGAFADLTYTYLPQGAVVKIDFKVEEAHFRKCFFDNFIWLGKDEIDSRLRKDLPLYVGVVPETGDLLDDIAAELEKLSQEKGVKVHVNRRVQLQAIGEKDWSHAYVAEGVKEEIKAVHFSGNLTVSPNELQKEANPLVGREYSAFGTDLFGAKTIAAFFADRGYLRVNVAPSVFKVLEHAEGSADFSVEITYPVTEGSLYHWQPAEWSGDQSIPSKDLDALTGMKPNDIANAKRIADGWEAIKDAYGHTGYLEAKLSPEPVLDDANLLVHYRVALAPGP